MVTKCKGNAFSQSQCVSMTEMCEMSRYPTNFLRTAYELKTTRKVGRAIITMTKSYSNKGESVWHELYSILALISTDNPS